MADKPRSRLYWWQRLGLVLVLLIGIGLIYAAYGYYGDVDLRDKSVSVIIESGDSFSSVARELSEAGAVRSPFMLKVGARLRGVDKQLTPGRYDFSGEVSARDILDKLALADFVRIRVTIYEGAPIWTVASILQDVMKTDSAALIALNSDSAFLDSLDLPYLEGYLFPQTYFFAWKTDLRTIVRDMVRMFRDQTEDLWNGDYPNDLTREEVIVLASIVEAEAFIDKEKPKIASVYHNRLERRMKLDADPTVIYGLGGLDRPLYRRDLRKMTPYNTYQRRGLPPTPINSPGLEAIKATLEPASTDYLFFVADGSGEHRFSRTNAEHNRNRYEIKQEQLRQQAEQQP